MDADFRFPSIYVPSTCTHRARFSRAAAGRAGLSFILSGRSREKNGI